MNHRSSSLARLASALAALLVGCGILAGCSGMASYPLPFSAVDAPRSFAPLRVCASQQGLEAVVHQGSSVNVKIEGGTWVQYMIQNADYNMVVILGGGIPEAERANRMSAAKAKGDELFACAMKLIR